MRTGFLLALALTLAACDTPGFMPAGYTYYNTPYKSAPGPKAPCIGYHYSPGKNAVVLAAWQDAVTDLFNRLEAQGLYPQPVYLDAPAPKNAFVATYDHVLRTELEKRGYKIQSDPGTVFHLRYDAYLPVKDEGKPARNTMRMQGSEDLVLVLTPSANGSAGGQVSGVYALPAYGFKQDKRSAPMARLIMDGDH